MPAFLIRIALFALPFAALLGAYFAFDPFRVLYDYEAFVSHNPVSINVDYLSTETWLRHREARRWDSFVFGSSRTLAFRAEDWQVHLPPGSRPFRFNASRESLFGLHRKIHLIDELGDPLRNALLLLDADLLAKLDDSERHLYVKHPRLSGRSALDFQALFAQSWFRDFFFLKYLHWRLSGTFRPYMSGAINPHRIDIDPEHNDVLLADREERLAADEAAYYREEAADFALAKTRPRTTGPVIGAGQRALLEEIRAVFDRHATRYEIVGSPNYHWPPLHPEDVAALQAVFGADHVHDYSGDLEITRNERNYYEWIHFRPFVGRRILSEIYR